MYKVKTIFNDGTCKVEKTDVFEQAIGAFSIYIADPEVEYTCVLRAGNNVRIIAEYDIREGI